MIFVEKKLLQEMRDDEPVSWMGIMWNSVKKQFFESRNNTCTRKSWASLQTSVTCRIMNQEKQCFALFSRSRSFWFKKLPYEIAELSQRENDHLMIALEVLLHQQKSLLNILRAQSQNWSRVSASTADENQKFSTMRGIDNP
jgi:hypothetical protein